MDLAALAAAFGALLPRLISIGVLLPAHDTLLFSEVPGFRAPLPRVGDLTCWGYRSEWPGWNFGRLNWLFSPFFILF
jgi:hypothetical protein